MTTASSRQPVVPAVLGSTTDDEYFYRMLSPYALKLSAPYNTEESRVLERCLRECSGIGEMNFVAVGGGELWELRRALAYAKRYVCIEPLAEVFINDSLRYLIEQLGNVSVVPKKFGDVVRADLPPGNSLFMFLFNVLAYIDDPVAAINRVLQRGDRLFVSAWADTPEAEVTRAAYFNYLNGQGDFIVRGAKPGSGGFSVANFPFDQLRYYVRHECIRGAVADILVIYT